MRLVTKSIAGAALAGGMMLAGGIAPAQAANNSQQGGLVNVSVGDVLSNNNVNIGVAAQLVADVCPSVNVGNIAVLAAQAARSGSASAVCSATGAPINLTQAIR
ncbi:hypothetical protein GCM10027449_24800 [Sinomonas notoginsengisoli]|uniref:hypothetical protein n=1 Tax=Sinomonas notoginsengisoli TaxID=1457311 RepID=UPI001F3E801E|nr:hypothetical protein [Sinomonas notoginsengisoli]